MSASWYEYRNIMFMVEDSHGDLTEIIVKCLLVMKINTLKHLNKDTFEQRQLSLNRRLSFIGRFFIYSRITTSNHHCGTENVSAVLCSSGSTVQHQAVGMRAIQTITELRKNPLY